MVFLEQISLYEWIILFLLPLTVGSVLKTWQLKKENSLLHRRLTKREQYLARLKKDFGELQGAHDRIREFQESLEEAELTTKLQQPRLQTVDGQMAGDMPEKYRYIRSLHEKGMDAGEIASILSISTQEAEQLVTLSKLAKEK